jgi:hypothetical protein
MDVGSSEQTRPDRMSAGVVLPVTHHNRELIGDNSINATTAWLYIAYFKIIRLANRTAMVSG